MNDSDKIAQHESERCSVVVVAPTYNNAATLSDILERISATGLEVIVVNDGSTDATAHVLSNWETRATVIHHDRNRGKAAAMMTGFAAARRAGFTHAVTIDTDGQHDPEQLPALAAEAQRHPDALLLGDRSAGMAATPQASRLGWLLSALALRFETGCTITDSQCGLRVYPLVLIEAVRCRFGRFGFEAEIIARASWAGFLIVMVPVVCRYLPGDERVSHFKPVQDGFRGFLMHAWLSFVKLFRWPRRARFEAGSVSSNVDAPRPVSWGLLNPISLWRQLRQDRFEQFVVASSVGIGTFMSGLPLGGWQILFGLYAAVRFRLHAIPVLLGSLLFLTPAGPWLADGTIGIGHLLLHASWETPAMRHGRAIDWAVLRSYPLAWPLGAVLVGTVGKWTTTFLLWAMLRVIPVRGS